jgi:hypothetical protein
MRPPAGSDNIAVMRSRLVRLAFVTLTVCTAMACQTPAPEGAKKDAVDTKTPATKDVKVPEPATTAVPAPTTDTAGAAAPGTASAPGAGEPSTLDPSAGDPTATSPGDAAATAGATPPPVDTAKLITEIKAKKTNDTRAKKALEEAEAGGATVRELAEASNARGEMLLGAGEPDRAKVAFEWARDKDTTYPEPSFNLAKQSVLAGDVAETVTHLKEVHKRGGKKLLKQVGFDPTFEIVKDDPEVAKIIK